MILYNVTVSVEDHIHDNWLPWMTGTHIPEVMATGCFVDYRMFRILSRQEDETGTAYSIQYFAPDLKTFERYRDEFAKGLQAKTAALFPEGFIAFRTVLEAV